MKNYLPVIELCDAIKATPQGVFIPARARFFRKRLMNQ